MPRPALTPELHADLMRLGAGAGDLWLQLYLRSDADGVVCMTEAQIAQATGRSVRWVSKAAVELRTNGWLEGGHGMWKIRSTSDVEETFHQQEQTFLNERATNANERSTNQHVRSTSEPVAPPPTPPTRTHVSTPSFLNANTNDENARTGKRGVGRKPKTPATIPDDAFQPDETRRTLAAELGVNCDFERDKFVDYCQANEKAYPQPQRAFGNWLRNAATFSPRRRSGPDTMRVGYQPSAEVIRPIIEPIDPAAMARKRAELEAQVERELAQRRRA